MENVVREAFSLEGVPFRVMIRGRKELGAPMVFFNYALRKLNAKIVYYGPGLVRKDDKPAVDPRPLRGWSARQDDLARHRGRSDDLLRPAPDRHRVDSRDGCDPPALHRARPGALQLDPAAGAARRRWCGLRRRLAAHHEAPPTRTLENLQENLLLQGIEITGFPHVLQFNKRDLRDLLEHRGARRESQRLFGSRSSRPSPPRASAFRRPSRASSSW